jgi:hypothetical protein
MKQVNFSYTVLTPWLLFLCPLLFYAVVFWLAVLLHIWEANSLNLNLDLETEHLFTLGTEFCVIIYITSIQGLR